MSELGQESCRTADESEIRAKVRTLEAPMLMIFLDFTRGDDDASVETSDKVGTFEVLLRVA